MADPGKPDANSTQSRILAGIVEIQRTIVAGRLDFRSALTLIAESACKFTPATGSAIGLLEREDVVYHAAAGGLEAIRGSRLSVSSAMTRQCLRTAKVLFCNDTQRVDFPIDFEGARRVGARSLVAVPVLHRRAAVGSLEVVSSAVQAFDYEHVRVLQLMAPLVWLAVRHDREAGTQARIVNERAAIRKAMTALSTVYDYLSAQQNASSLPTDTSASRLESTPPISPPALERIKTLLASVQESRRAAAADPSLQNARVTESELVAPQRPSPPDLGLRGAATSIGTSSQFATGKAPSEVPVFTTESPAERHLETTKAPGIGSGTDSGGWIGSEAAADRPQSTRRAGASAAKDSVSNAAVLDELAALGGSEVPNVGGNIAGIESLLMKLAEGPGAQTQGVEPKRSELLDGEPPLAGAKPACDSPQSVQSLLAQLGTFIQKYENGELSSEVESVFADATAGEQEHRVEPESETKAKE